jgi:hypothetical protein
MHCVPIEEDHWLLLYVEIITVYSENHILICLIGMVGG